MKNKKTSNKGQQYFDDNPVEAVRNFGGSVANSFKDDLVKEGFSDLWSQILGEKKEQKQQSGDLEEGKEINFKKTTDKKTSNEERVKNFIEPGLNYRREIIHAETRKISENQREISSKIQEIVFELQKLIASSEQLKLQFKEVAVMQITTKPGKYHVNFFEWLLINIKQARTKVEDSSAWLNVMKSKKAAKQYWSQFAKKGTSFGLSSERNIATQAG